MILPILMSAVAAMPDAHPQALPDSVRTLAEQAISNGDEEALRSVLDLARAAWPGAAPEIDVLAQYYTAAMAEKQKAQAKLKPPTAQGDLPANWHGEAELGGSRSSGNTDLLALYGALRLERRGQRWSHGLNGRIDFQQSEGRTIADRYNIDWQPRFTVREGLFAYGLAQYEHDRFVGFESRYTLSAGVGLALMETPSASLKITGGPAIRHIDYIDEPDREQAAGRLALNFTLKVTPTVGLTQDASIYAEGSETNALSTTSFETSLTERIKARFSWNVQYEDSRLAGRQPIDTTSRASIAYKF